MSLIYKMNLPKELIKNLITIHGVQGKKWLDALLSFYLLMRKNGNLH